MALIDLNAIRSHDEFTVITPNDIIDSQFEPMNLYSIRRQFDILTLLPNTIYSADISNQYGFDNLICLPYIHLFKIVYDQYKWQFYTRYTSRTIKYPYIFLARTPSPPRTAVYQWLLDYNTDGAISWLNYFGDVSIMPERHLEGDVNGTVNHLVPPQYAHASLDIVVETASLRDDMPFIYGNMVSEKTFKPILCRKPFLLFASEPVKEFLRLEGFDLFDELHRETIETTLSYALSTPICNVDIRVAANHAVLMRIINSKYAYYKSIRDELNPCLS